MILKKYISDVFNDLSDSAGKTFCGYTISESMDELARERVYRSVMDRIEARQAKHSLTIGSVPFKKVAVAAAACVAAASMGVVGVGAAKLYKGFADYNPSYTEEQKAAIEKVSRVVGKSISGEGIIFTATEAMYDGEKLFLMLETTIDPEKISVSKDRIFGCNVALHLTGDPNDTQGFPAQYHKVLGREGNTCTELVVFDAVDLKDGSKAALSAWGLGVFDNTLDEASDKSEIRWAVDSDTRIGSGFIFDYKKGHFAKKFSSENGVKHLGEDARVLAGYIAPWYAQFDLGIESDDESILQSIADDRNTPKFEVVMKDGTVHNGVGVSCGGSAGGTDQGNYFAGFNFRCSFKEYVEPSEIDHIEINGCKVYLKKA